MVGRRNYSFRGLVGSSAEIMPGRIGWCKVVGGGFL